MQLSRAGVLQVAVPSQVVTLDAAERGNNSIERETVHAARGQSHRKWLESCMRALFCFREQYFYANVTATPAASANYTRVSFDLCAGTVCQKVLQISSARGRRISDYILIPRTL